jgi:2-polyprenyl-3-methyl-5-hydroxy-6-metoxy-1,4-benzoquinol methylase
MDFCTYFDRNYLWKGLGLYESLNNHCPDFRLWILCMDDKTETILNALRLPKVTLLSLERVEDEALRVAKRDRTAAEYCWTVTPHLPLYLFQKYGDIEVLAYLDADLYFFSNPKPIYDEFGSNSIGIFEHRFPDENIEQAKRVGIFNVGMLLFRNDREAHRCLQWWSEKCLKSCQLLYDGIVVGDQGYLNDWPQRFGRVAVIQYEGGGIGPWNIGRYEFSKKDGEVYVNSVPLIFYHFIRLKICRNLKYDYAPVPRNVEKLIYFPYTNALSKAIRLVWKVDASKAFEYSKAPGPLIRLKRKVKGPLLASVNSTKTLKRKVIAKVEKWRNSFRMGQNHVFPQKNTLRNSWKDESVAQDQLKLVETQIDWPQLVPPYKIFVKVIRDILMQYMLPNPAMLLDIGCGVGHYGELIRRYLQRSFIYTGTDYSKYMIKAARETWPDYGTFIVDDIFHSSMRYYKFDILMASALVDVIDEFEKVLNILLSNTHKILILHRQRITEQESYSVVTKGYPGQETCRSFLNLADLLEKCKKYNLEVRKEVEVQEGIYTFVIVNVSWENGL